MRVVYVTTGVGQKPQNADIRTINLIITKHLWFVL